MLKSNIVNCVLYTIWLIELFYELSILNSLSNSALTTGQSFILVIVKCVLVHGLLSGEFSKGTSLISAGYL